jgi:S1/P1 Nuclease
MRRKHSLLLFGLFVVSVVLISWGVTGHRAIGRLAENHLSPQAKAGIQELLGSASLADVSTWADEVRNLPEYRPTGAWHYLNLPLGLSFTDFEKQVKGMTEENVYSALLKEEQALSDKATPREKKVEALKFIVHFVGDLHQPMHISRSEDKGGNTIQVNYDGSGTNLHSLWDSKLIDHLGLTYDLLAEKCDHNSAAQVKQWQSDPLIRWIWESYVVSSTLYGEIDAMKGRALDDSYYQAHIGIIQQRIAQAGIRLAGVLNEIFKNGPMYGTGYIAPAGSGAGAPAVGRINAPPDGAAAGGAPKTIELADAAKHINEYVTLSAKIYGYKTLESMTLVNMGAAYPDQLLTVVLRGDAKEAYKGLDGQTVTVTGKLVNYKDKPEIVITDPAMIRAGK